MAGLIRPRTYPIRQIGDNKQDAGQIYNPHRFPTHGGFTDASKWPRGDAGFRDVEPPTKINPAESANRRNDD